MRIYTKAGDLAFKEFTFPDGQPHFKLETYGVEFTTVTIELALRNPGDLLMLLLVSSVLRNQGYSVVNLDIRYLLGARMDRAIDSQQPFTLEVVARLINGAGFNRVRILDAHSDVAFKLIRNSSNLLPFVAFDSAYCTSGPSTLIIVPDKGAVERLAELAPGYNKVYCEKLRDPQTGKLSDFRIRDTNLLEEASRHGSRLLIVDDICDGGGTFVGLAEKLSKWGPVDLFVTHGIFSKGLPLDGIDRIYTTDSYRTWCSNDTLVSIPVSMKEMG